ncbi:Dam family site-specific DNA-(adenine-N6)-methyltransferase [Legionella oakridgensis]|nr:Dam family site-specific DNA-(adenine-N6)-methyltransferase [Legionella oakridgensis]
MIKIRPFLKWAGNKYRCLDNILNSLPTANRLIEPFAGSAAVFINSDYPRYLLAEENKDLIALFSCLQTEGHSFISFCEQYFCHTNNCAGRYYDFRDQFNQCTEARQRAALFLYLNRHGYNGLCRYNQKGIYNVPFGRYQKPYFPKAEMEYFHQKSQKAKFIHSDFRDTFAHATPGDLIYCDPPYAPRLQNSNFTSYTDKKFGEQEQIILAELAMESAARGITVIISNHDTDFTRHYYRFGDIKSFAVTRSISCQIHRRLSVNELLVIFR